MRHNYRLQKACANCVHIFLWEEYDCYPKIHCTLGAPERPWCGSVLLNEPAHKPEYNEKAWLEWSENRAVNANGICDDYAATHLGIKPKNDS